MDWLIWLIDLLHWFCFIICLIDLFHWTPLFICFIIFFIIRYFMIFILCWVIHKTIIILLCSSNKNVIVHSMIYLNFNDNLTGKLIFSYSIAVVQNTDVWTTQMLCIKCRSISVMLCSEHGPWSESFFRLENKCTNPVTLWIQRALLWRV